MIRPKRFRDMSLTPEEVEHLVLVWFTWRIDGDEDGPFEQRRYKRIEARAKRLLPLWRQLGLKELSCKSTVATIGEYSYGCGEYKGPWASWLSWFLQVPFVFPADYQVVFRVSKPRRKKGGAE